MERSDINMSIRFGFYKKEDSPKLVAGGRHTTPKAITDQREASSDTSAFTEASSLFQDLFTPGPQA